MCKLFPVSYMLLNSTCSVSANFKILTGHEQCVTKLESAVRMETQVDTKNYYPFFKYFTSVDFQMINALSNVKLLQLMSSDTLCTLFNLIKITYILVNFHQKSHTS
jgi:hypothetical protein